MADYVTIIHECADFPVWKKAYDADLPRRKAAGLTEIHLLRENSNPNQIALMFQVSDVARAKALTASPELASTMKAAGIIGAPKVRFRQGDYQRKPASTYATITAVVRDYATAMKAYAMDAADRKKSGLTDLGVLQLKDDPNGILILWTVDDIARATAFFESPSLAAHMVNNAGVIGPPERHFWRS